MLKLVLDTSVLLRWWNQRRSQARGEFTVRHVARWAEDLITRWDRNAIVTPVYVEIVGGATNAREFRLMQIYLEPFECIDRLRILPEDWREAIRLAQRVRRDRRPRDLGDCLIRAIANRLTYDVVTHDQGFPG